MSLFAQWSAVLTLGAITATTDGDWRVIAGAFLGSFFAAVVKATFTKKDLDERFAAHVTQWHGRCRGQIARGVDVEKIGGIGA